MNNGTLLASLTLVWLIVSAPSPAVATSNSTSHLAYPSIVPSDAVDDDAGVDADAGLCVVVVWACNLVVLSRITHRMEGVMYGPSPNAPVVSHDKAVPLRSIARCTWSPRANVPRSTAAPAWSNSLCASASNPTHTTC